MTYTDSPDQSSYIPPQQQPPRRKHTLRKWLLIASAVFAGVLAVVLVLALTVGAAFNSTQKRAAGGATTPAASVPAAAAPDTAEPATTAPPEPSGPAMLAVGDSETVTEGDVPAATITITSVQVRSQPADVTYGSRPANGYYVIAHVTVTADPGYTGGFSAYTGDFYARTGGQHFDEGNGNSYEAVTDTGSELGFTNLAAGETARGTLLFDLPARHGHIVYAPNYDGQPLAEWEY